MQQIEMSGKERFALEILDMAEFENLNLVDALVAYAERNSVNMDDIVDMLDDAMKARIRQCALENRMVVGVKLEPVLEL